MISSCSYWSNIAHDDTEEEEIPLPGMISIADEPRTLRCNKFINSVSYCATRGDYKSTHWKETYAFKLVLRHRTLVAIIASKPLSEKEHGEKRSEKLLDMDNLSHGKLFIEFINFLIWKERVKQYTLCTLKTNT